MYPFDKDNPCRRASVKVLMPLLLKSGLSANTVTLLNFFVFGVASIVCFLASLEYLGLLFGVVMAMVDYADGTLARAKKQVSNKGAYLDTSLDWLYLMLVILSLSHVHHLELCGMITLISLAFGNWVEYHGKVIFNLWGALRILPLLGTTVLFGFTEFGLIAVMVTQTYRTIILYWRSVHGASTAFGDNWVD